MTDIFISFLLQKSYVIIAAILGSLLSTSTLTFPEEFSSIPEVIQEATTTKPVSIKKSKATASTKQVTTHEEPVTNEGVATSTKVSHIFDDPTYEVTSVVDGDTIKVSIDNVIETVRIIGINTPETVDPRRPIQCFGKEASDEAKQLLVGKVVTLEADHTQTDRDKYGRLLRYVFIDGEDYGKGMIRDGYAYEYTYNIPYIYQKEYKTAQKSAENARKGLWSGDTCATETTKSTDGSTVEGYYTSSSIRAKNYYPAACNSWKTLSKLNIQLFNSLDELLKSYPGRTLSKQCE